MTIVVVNTEHSTTTLSNIDETCMQQAAVDLRLENVWRMSGTFTIDEEKKQHRNTQPVSLDIEGYYTLTEGVYECSFDHDISIGADEASLVITRSTLVRNGCQLVSGLWDPKFEGRGGCALHVKGGHLRIKPGTRVGQFVTWKVANAQGAYNGSYGLNADGTPKEMEAKYHAEKPVEAPVEVISLDAEAVIAEKPATTKKTTKAKAKDTV
jgi:deoxycytidine triphosphate deaminase